MRKRRWGFGIFGLLILLGGGFLMAALRPPAYKFLEGAQYEGTTIFNFGAGRETHTSYKLPRRFEEVSIQAASDLGRPGLKDEDFGAETWSDGTRRIAIWGEVEVESLGVGNSVSRDRTGQMDKRVTFVYIITPTTWMDRVRVWIQR